jgi:hypothetical protein
MTRLWRLRLWTVALLVGVASQTSVDGAVRSPAAHGCSAELLDVSRSAGWTPTPSSTITCFPAGGDSTVHVALRDQRPSAGERCADVHFALVSLTVSDDTSTATFPVFGGRSQGTIRLSPEQVARIGSRVAYVADAQLGSYEDVGGRLVCSLDPTFHFVCPTTGELDRLCLVWFRREVQQNHV